MIKNYLLIALRSIFKQKLFSFINVFGLGLGIAATIVIVLYARYDLTYDQHHRNSEDIYLIYKERKTPNGIQPTYDTWVPLLSQLKTDFPEVISGTRIFQDNLTISVDNNRFNEDAYYVDNDYFKTFDYPLFKGNNDKPFTSLNSIIISRSTAQKLFGDQDPIGKELQIDFQTNYLVSGILENYPRNTFFGADILIQLESHPQYESVSKEWGSSFINTLILLPPGTNPQELEAKFPSFIGSIWDEETQKRTNFRLLPLHDSFDTFVGDRANSYILLIIAIGIIGIASINFMNLSMVQSMDRSREIGMRKVMGAGKGQLISQHLIEAVILTTLAMLIGVFLAQSFIPWLNETYSVDIGINYFDGISIPILVAFAISLGLLSGSFPAFGISKFKILDSLKGALGKSIKGGIYRNALVIVQFTLSIILIMGTLIVARQINFMKNTDLAFRKENLLVIPIGQSDFPDRDDGRIRLETFRNELIKYSSIESVANSTHVPGRWSGSNTFVKPEGWDGDPLRMRYTYHDQKFFETYGIELTQGEGFLADTEGDQRSSVVLNEAAMKAFGWEDYSGKNIVLGNSKVNVVGVIKDFNYESLQNEIAPILHFHRTPSNGTHQYITARVNPEDLDGTLDYIKDKWSLLDEELPFNYYFMEEDMASIYQNEDRLLRMVALFSGISIFISCLGLFGLSAFLIEKRKKEIGIRKVLGASVVEVVVMITNRFNRLIIASFIIAAPTAWFLMAEWQSGFAYQAQINLSLVFISLLLTLVIGWVAVGFKSIQAAMRDPVNSIREE